MSRAFPWTLAFALAACSGQKDASVQPGAPAPPQPERVLLADSPASLAMGATRTSFSFASLRDLWVRLIVPGTPPPATVLRLAFVAPSGQTFYQESQQFSTDPKVTTTSLPGMQFPVAVRTATQLAGGWAFDHFVPVAGGSFSRFPQPGTWQVQASVDGVPGSATQSFDVTFER